MATSGSCSRSLWPKQSLVRDLRRTRLSRRNAAVCPSHDQHADDLLTRLVCSHDQVGAMRLSDQSNESPDLGPPPVAHFDCEDPIKFHAAPESAESPNNDNDHIPASLSVNLETRRKRKDSHQRTAVACDSEEKTAPSRPQSKRKLSMRDEEESDSKPAKDDFVFSRRASVSGDSRKMFEEAQNQMMEPSRPERKILGDSE